VYVEAWTNTSGGGDDEGSGDCDGVDPPTLIWRVREISNPTTNANDQPGTTNHQVPTTNHELEPAQLQVSSHLQPPTTSGYSSGGV